MTVLPDVAPPVTGRSRYEMDLAVLDDPGDRRSTAAVTRRHPRPPTIHGLTIPRPEPVRVRRGPPPHQIETLRNELIPRTLGSVPNVETAVTGPVAEDVDFTHQVKHGMPYVAAFVLGLAFLLLLVTFRSLVVPIKAIVLNLLSVSLGATRVRRLVAVGGADRPVAAAPRTRTPPAELKSR